MIIRKAEHKRDYTCISNEILQRKDMSMRAKGLLVYLLSLPEDWEIHKTELWKHFTDGRDAVFRAFEELEKNGYIQGKRYRDQEGKFRVQYTVYEEPQTPELKTRYGPTDTVFQKVISTYKQSIYKEEKKDFFKKENQKQEKKESTQKEEKNTSMSIEEIEAQIATAPKWLKKYLIELKQSKESQKQH
jgi:DNA-binding transcriptional MocR family regulator